MKTDFICYYMFVPGAMPIPLDIANLASLNMKDDIHLLGTLDVANLNASGHNDIQPHEEPIASAALVNDAFYLLMYR